MQFDNRGMMLLRNFFPTDLGNVMRMVAENFMQDYPPSMYLSLNAYWPDGFLVASEDEKIMGFLLGSMTSPEEARILIMSVRADVRNRGVGTALLNDFLARCGFKGIRRVVLEVRTSNAHARNFYSNRGFQVDGVLKKYYLDGENAIKMIRWL